MRQRYRKVTIHGTGYRHPCRGMTALTKISCLGALNGRLYKIQFIMSHKFTGIIEVVKIKVNQLTG